MSPPKGDLPEGTGNGDVTAGAAPVRCQLIQPASKPSADEGNSNEESGGQLKAETHTLN